MPPNLLPYLKANSIVERVRTNSVLNPLLWLCGITEFTALPAAYLSEGYAKVFFCTLAALPVAAAIIAYFMWMFRDPNRLQSEDYQLAQQRLSQGTKEEDDFPTISESTDHHPKLISPADSERPDDAPEYIESPSSDMSRNGGA